MKLRLYYTRNDELKFISHLNTIDLLQRAVFSTDAQVAFSEGFNPHPKMSFGNPLPLGVSSDLEVFDVELTESVNIDIFVKQLNEFLPKQVQIFKAFEPKEKSISKIFTHSIYEFKVYTDLNLDEIKEASDTDIFIERKKKSKKKGEVNYIKENITEYVQLLSSFEKVDNYYKLTAKLENSSNKIINPLNFIQGLFNKYNLNIDAYDVSIHKKEMI